MKTCMISVWRIILWISMQGNAQMIAETLQSQTDKSQRHTHRDHIHRDHTHRNNTNRNNTSHTPTTDTTHTHTNSAHERSWGVMPATTSGRQEANKNSNTGGTDPTGDKRRQHSRQALMEHRALQSAAPATNSSHGAVVCLPGHLRVKKKAKTLIIMKKRTGNHHPQTPTTHHQRLTEHAGLQSTGATTNSLCGGAQSAMSST